jgi:signal transduction histidine kinase
MEAVGRLAGGVAHDFNNLLTVILGYTTMVLGRAGLEEPVYRPLEEVRKAAERARALTNQLLAFGRKQVLAPQVLDLNGVLADMLELLRRLIGEHIELDLVAAPELGAVRADPNQVQQVVLNLATNARDAMPAGGRLTLETYNLDWSAETDPSRAMPAGRYVGLVVIDTGVGMDPETASHIFEPFFTTKELGKGTGLGLATVYGIVKQSNGFIWLESAPGRGSRFEVLLPRVG